MVYASACVEGFCERGTSPAERIDGERVDRARTAVLCGNLCGRGVADLRLVGGGDCGRFFGGVDSGGMALDAYAGIGDQGTHGGSGSNRG